LGPASLASSPGRGSDGPELTRRRAAAFVVSAAVAGAVLAGPVTPARAAAITTLAVPTSIDPTGAADVTDVLNGFLARVPAGSTVAFPKDARYRVDGTVTLPNRRDVTVEGNRATFFAPTDGSTFAPPRNAGARAGWPRLRQHWKILGGGGITIRDIRVRGANANGGAAAGSYVPALEGQAGIAIQRTSGVLIDSVQVSETYGDGVYITGGAVNVTVRNSTFERIGRQGIAIVNGARITVEGNKLRDIARSVFDLEPGGRAVVQEIHLQGNTVGSYVNFLLASGGGGPGVDDIWLERNRVDGGHGVSVFAGVEGRRRAGYHIVGNSGTGAARPPGGTARPGLIQLLNLDRVEIRGNRQPVAGVPAVSLDRVCGVTVADNQFPGASRDQLVVRPCGAAAPPPSAAAGKNIPTTATSAAGVTPSTKSGGSTDAGSLVAAGLVGLALGLGAGGAAFAVWRSRTRLR
jgi:hypothetical protein